MILCININGDERNMEKIIIGATAMAAVTTAISIGYHSIQLV